MHFALAALATLLFLAGAHAAPSVYPTGTTIFDPAKAWSGYTVFVLPETGAVLGAVGALPPQQESVAALLARA